MTIIQAVVLGVIQGITEFLPISSSGHLIFVPAVFGWTDQGLSFDVVVHLGTLVAVVLYFWKDIVSVVSKQRRLGALLLLSMIPALFVGFLLDVVYGVEIRSPLVVATGLIGWGAVLWIADRYSQGLANRERGIEKMGWKRTLFIGCAQAIALIPGTSRSGITMTAGLFAKLDRTTAARFSFLMSVPIIAIAGAVKMVDLVSGGGGDVAILPMVVGFFASAASGYIAIAGLMKIIQKWSFAPFALYRIVVGVLILLFLV